MFLPSNKDLKTFLEVFTIFQWMIAVFMIATTVISVNIYLLLFTRYWLVTVLTVIWLAFDWKTAERGGRRFNFMRRCCLWKHYRDYFPVKLLKTHDISPDKNYILVGHPHGVLAHSWFSNFVTDSTGFPKLFPGMTPYVLTLGIFFWVPVLRDYAMSLGLCSVSSSSIDYLLSQKGTGKMLVVVVGGLAECKFTLPGCSMLYLKNRCGFVRKALQHGVPLIPAYAFGDVLYDQWIFTPGGLVNRFQKWFHSMTRIYPCVFSGRGFTENSWGLLPHARPQTTIVGEPLPMPKIENPSKEEVDKYHALYIEALQKLFDQHKTKFGIPETRKLVIV